MLSNGAFLAHDLLKFNLFELCVEVDVSDDACIDDDRRMSLSKTVKVLVFIFALTFKRYRTDQQKC